MEQSTTECKFKIGDRVIGNANTYQMDFKYNGKTGVVTYIHVDHIGNNRIHYSDTEYWYYKDEELTIDKNTIVKEIIKDL